MAYSKTNRLNMRRVATGVSEYVGVGGVWDVLSSIGKGAAGIYNQGQQAQGAAQAQNALLQADMARANQSDDTTLLVVGGIGVAAVLFFALRKK